MLRQKNPATDATVVLWLQISGASLLSIPDIKESRFGEASTKIYDDWDDTSEIRALIDNNPARAVDQHVLGFARSHSDQVRTALIFPPIIFGQGRGLGNNKSIQIPSLCRTAVASHQSVYVGRGRACWGNVHIADLARLVADLMNAHMNPQHEHDLWNEEGLYLPATSEMVSTSSSKLFFLLGLILSQTWFSIAEAIAKAAEEQGIKAPPSAISVKDADALFAHGSVLFGTNARSVPGRATRLLGYKSRQHSLSEEVAITFLRELRGF